MKIVCSKSPLQSVVENFNLLLVQSAKEPTLVSSPHHKRDPAPSCEHPSRQWATHHLPAAQHWRSIGQATGLPKSPPKIPLPTLHHHHAVPSPQPQLTSAPEQGQLFFQSLWLREQHAAWAALTQRGAVTLGTGRRGTFLLAPGTQSPWNWTAGLCATADCLPRKDSGCLCTQLNNLLFPSLWIHPGLHQGAGWSCSVHYPHKGAQGFWSASPQYRSC